MLQKLWAYRNVTADSKFPAGSLEKLGSAGRKNTSLTDQSAKDSNTSSSGNAMAPKTIYCFCFILCRSLSLDIHVDIRSWPTLSKLLGQLEEAPNFDLNWASSDTTPYTHPDYLYSFGFSAYASERTWNIILSSRYNDSITFGLSHSYKRRNFLRVTLEMNPNL